MSDNNNTYQLIALVAVGLLLISFSPIAVAEADSPRKIMRIGLELNRDTMTGEAEVSRQYIFLEQGYPTKTGSKRDSYVLTINDREEELYSTTFNFPRRLHVFGQGETTFNQSETEISVPYFRRGTKAVVYSPKGRKLKEMSLSKFVDRRQKSFLGGITESKGFLIGIGLAVVVGIVVSVFLIKIES